MEGIGVRKKIIRKYSSMEDRKGVVDSIRRKRRYFMAVAKGLSIIMVCGSVLLFVVLKLQEKKRRVHLDAMYMAGVGNMIGNE